jgi:hypothetical protein
MVKSVRPFVLVAVLSLSVAPSLYAERGGTNPHPQAVAAAVPLTTFQIITYTVFSYFGY